MKLIFAIALCIFLGACSTSSVKNMPEEGNWTQCPVCNGTGYEIVYEKYADSNSASKEMSPAADCLFSVFRGTDKYRDYEWEKQEKENKGEYTGESSGPDVIKRKIKCRNCNGVGWIEYIPVDIE
ncbi:MAG: hypothetical protein JW982_10670 [Spirochaetes bacterium]|nr:hypothetical protein [Spirochaetota bacterium]